MEQFKKLVDQEVKKFRADVEEMHKSENLYYATPGVKEYETKQKRDALEKWIREINKEFTATIDAKIAEMEPVAAKSYFKPSEIDRKLVDEYVTEFLADAKLGYAEKDKLDAFDRFEQKLGYLDENGLHEVRKRLPELFDQLGNDETLKKKLRGMNATFKQLQTAEQMQLEELKEQRANGIDATYRRLRLVPP